MMDKATAYLSESIILGRATGMFCKGLDITCFVNKVLLVHSHAIHLWLLSHTTTKLSSCDKDTWPSKQGISSPLQNIPVALPKIIDSER